MDENIDLEWLFDVIDLNDEWYAMLAVGYFQFMEA